jgi:hypothetical protein
MPRLTLLALLVAVACGGPRYRRIVAPDGRDAGLLECKTVADCYDEAGDLCPQGYRVLDGEQHQEIASAPNLYTGQQMTVARNRVTLLFRCKAGND